MTYDVTAALNAIGICVFMADIYVEPPEEMGPGVERRPLELHRFLVHLSDGCRLSTAEQKRCANVEALHPLMKLWEPRVRHMAGLLLSGSADCCCGFYTFPPGVRSVQSACGTCV